MTFDELAATKPPCALTQEQRQRPMAWLFWLAVDCDRPGNQSISIRNCALDKLTADRGQDAAVSRQEIR